MRTENGELIVKPFGLISGPYALNRRGVVFHNLARAVSFSFIAVLMVLPFFNRGLPNSWLAFAVYALVLVLTFVLSMAALRNGRKLPK